MRLHDDPFERRLTAIMDGLYLILALVTVVAVVATLTHAAAFFSAECPQLLREAVL